MIGAAAEYTPETGALGLSFMGGVGMFAVSLWQPVIGKWIDSARVVASTNPEILGIEDLTQRNDAIELAAGQATLSNIALFPLGIDCNVRNFIYDER